MEEAEAEIPRLEAEARGETVEEQEEPSSEDTGEHRSSSLR
ncbi:MAG: hypothetical protein CM15mV133_290 [uncultured marine virus]|nr:MAG: hypothetical protein CM15mV133_290 [uncultured marine virus]